MHLVFCIPSTLRLRILLIECHDTTTALISHNGWIVR